jgi:hypothetical protein
MNKILFLILFLIPVIVFGQTIGAPSRYMAGDGDLVKTYTTYTTASNDTTGWLAIKDPVIGDRPLLASELYAIWVSTDSTHATVNFIGGNNTLSDVATNSLSSGTIGTTAISNFTYIDSLPLPGNKAYTSTLPYVHVITLKSPSIDRLPGCTRLKIGTVFINAANQGNSARTGKWYLKWKR